MVQAMKPKKKNELDAAVRTTASGGHHWVVPAKFHDHDIMTAFASTEALASVPGIPHTSLNAIITPLHRLQENTVHSFIHFSFPPRLHPNGPAVLYGCGLADQPTRLIPCRKHMKLLIYHTATHPHTLFTCQTSARPFAVYLPCTAEEG